MKGSGQKPPLNRTHSIFGNTPGSDLVTVKEHHCIFPFYYKEKKFESCALFESSNFAAPVWRCPTRNITTKYPGTDINHFRDDFESNKAYCYDIDLARETCDPSQYNGGPGCQRLLDVDADCPDFLRLPPFSTCKSDCPGVRGLGVVGGGAVLFAASPLAVQSVLPFLGLGIGTAATGTVLTRAMCLAPFCSAQSGQCCLLISTRRGPRCPRSC